MFVVVKRVQSFWTGTVRQGVGSHGVVGRRHIFTRRCWVGNSGRYSGCSGYSGYSGNSGVSFVEGLGKSCPFGRRVDDVFALVSPFFPFVEFFLVGFFLGEGGFGPGIERTGGKENEKECEDGPSETWFGSGGGHRSWGWNIFCLLQVIVRAVRQRASFFNQHRERGRNNINTTQQTKSDKRRESVFFVSQNRKV